MFSRIVFPIALAAVVGFGVVAVHRIRSAPQETLRNAAAAAVGPAASLASPPPPAAEAPTASLSAEAPARMTSVQEAEFEAWIVKTYLACWKPAAQAPDSDPYVARVRIAFRPDGSFAKAPKLVNPPSDPALKPQAKSVMAAVQACNPLPVPAQYRPFYEQWRLKTIQFSPQVASR